MTEPQRYSFGERVLFRVAEILGPGLIRGLGFLCRYEQVGSEHYDAARARGKGVILALWHGRMLLPVYHHRRMGIVSLVSLHRDGEYIARIVRRLGYIVRRGSPKEGGYEGFRAMMRDLKAARTVAIFPDGPTGPRYTVKDGVIHLARLTGAPIVPLTFASRGAWRMKSWDGYMIMKPFSRGVLIYGEPFTLPRRMSGDDSMERYRERIREAIETIRLEADRRMGIVESSGVGA